MKNYNLTKNLYNLEKILFFLTVLLLPTQLGKHFWPAFSSVYSLRIDYLSPTVYLWDLQIYALMMVWVARFFLKPSSFRLNQLAIFIFLFFLLTQLVSMVGSPNPGASLVRVKEYFFAILLGVYLASSSLTDIKKSLITGLLGAVVGSSLLAIAQFLSGHSLGLWILGERSFSVTTPLISKFTFYDRVFLRPYATFSHPNLLAGFLAVALPLIAAGLENSLQRLKVMLVLIISSTVFITFSRPGLIIIGLYVLVFFKRFWKLLLLLAAITAPLLLVRFTSIFTFDSLAVLRREELSDFAIKIFFENPLIGAGLNSFINRLASSEVLVGTSRFLQPVHNIFLLVLSETGILGLLGFLGMLGFAFWVNLKKSSPFSKALLTSLLMIIFLGFFDHYFLTLPQGQRLLFMVVGLSLSRLRP